MKLKTPPSYILSVARGMFINFPIININSEKQKTILRNKNDKSQPASQPPPTPQRVNFFLTMQYCML